MSAKALSGSVIILTTSVLLIATTTFLQFGIVKHTRRGLVDDPEVVGKRVTNEEENNENDVPKYDYIIVGGGTSGCVLASRLSEDPDKTVLLLEAGESGVALSFSRIPAAFGKFMKSKHDFHLWTVPQRYSGGTAKYWPRPKLLGGCSSVNAMMFHCGVPSDYDEWAAIMYGEEGCEKWKYENIKKYFTKFERFTQHRDYPHVEASVRGVGGLMQTGYFGHLSNIASKFIVACQNVGIKLSHDVNNPSSILGITKMMTYIDHKGRRSSTESAYLTPHVLQRDNLVVATHATVTRILFDRKFASRRVVGVEFASARNGPRYRAGARKEIILSAGAVHTPHILLLSGVGPNSHLTKYGIDCVHDLPGVGQRLTDHLVVQARFRARPGETFYRLNDQSWRAPLRRLFSFFLWRFFGRGPLTSNLGEAAAFIRAGDPALFPSNQFPKKVQEVGSGPGAPDLEIYCTPLGYKSHGFEEIPKGDILTISALLLRPLSNGCISLDSSDPFDPPMIDPSYFAHPNDLQILVRGMRLMIRIAKTEPLASLLVVDDDPRLDHNLNKLSDEALESIVRERGETPYHPACSARMAPLAQGGVVDAKLRVYGVPNLRIVDASVFPTIVSGHTAAPCIAIAEFAADLISE